MSWPVLGKPWFNEGVETVNNSLLCAYYSQVAAVVPRSTVFTTKYITSLYIFTADVNNMSYNAYGRRKPPGNLWTFSVNIHSERLAPPAGDWFQLQLDSSNDEATFGKRDHPDWIGLKDRRARPRSCIVRVFIAIFSLWWVEVHTQDHPWLGHCD